MDPDNTCHETLRASCYCTIDHYNEMLKMKSSGKKKEKSKQQANKEMYYQINEISFKLPMEAILTLMSYAFLLTELRVSSIIYRLATPSACIPSLTIP